MCPLLVLGALRTAARPQIKYPATLQIAQLPPIPAVNPVGPPPPSRTATLLLRRSQNHDDLLASLNLQLIQNEFGGVRQQGSLPHRGLRGITRA